MDKSYSVAKFGLESKELLRSNHKNCWYYCKYFFFFTAIIQFLIILSLVLFMIYGNAHITTENRLKNVEDLNQKLLTDIQQLKEKLGATSSKLNSTAAESKACSAELKGKKLELENMNKTVLNQNFRIGGLQKMAMDCKTCADKLHMLNMSCFAEKITMHNWKKSIESEYKSCKENCSNDRNTLSSQLLNATLEKENYRMEMINIRNQKSDAERQKDMLKGSCTQIDEKFNSELQRMRETLAATIQKYESSMEPCSNLNVQNCKLLNTETVSNIERALIKLRQDISSTLSENSQLKASKDRTEEDRKKCIQEKSLLFDTKNKEMAAMQFKWDEEIRMNYQEKNLLRKEKSDIMENFKGCSDSLEKNKILFKIKTEELQRCQLLIPQIPSFHGLSQG